jgi:hypothetical protein
MILMLLTRSAELGLAVGTAPQATPVYHLTCEAAR